MALDHFHPSIQRWFSQNLGMPTWAQSEGWPAIARGEHTLIAAPTGSGKTLAAFLNAIDTLFKQGNDLPDQTQVLYVSPLRALSNDVQKNLQAPLDAMRHQDLFLPEVRVLVRTGDTSASERAAMKRLAPHILVTTPESLYILLSSEGGRNILKDVKTVIVDEIHALAGDKRGAHLALSLERLEHLSGPVQRIGLSATQKPIENMAAFLSGPQRSCTIVDGGHRRQLDLAVCIPGSPLQTLCSHETWDEIYNQVAGLVEEHQSTLVFVNTRKMSEQVAARLSDRLGSEVVSSHHGSLSKERRLEAEQKLKAGELKVLVATASLELGIDIGHVDLVIQLGIPFSIATFLQRVGRARHQVAGVPKGRLFPLTIDELQVTAALLRAVKQGQLDGPRPQQGPLDILAQQVVAACASQTWSKDELRQCFQNSQPYAGLDAKTFDQVINLHTGDRHSLLHEDKTMGTIRGTRRARLTAMLSGGAIPDLGDYRVILNPEGVMVGSVNEDFAIESNVGDIFQLGNASWRILKVEQGAVHVADAQGAPPTIPFWFGEAPGRSDELSQALSQLRSDCTDRSWLIEECDLPPAAAEQLWAFFESGKEALGGMPDQEHIVAERFFDQSGGMQLVIHLPFGSRINKAYGLALRKRFCRGFGFELQAAANDDAVVISLGAHHSFPIEDIFGYLHHETCREVLIQAMIDQPVFQSRWRWNITRALVVERSQGGRRVPTPIQRMRADDALVKAFPQALACAETLSGPDREIPTDHPLVYQTIEDCLTEAMDVTGLQSLLKGMKDQSIAVRGIDTAEPSVFARSILTARPYAFLDDAPLEERRTQAVMMRHTLDSKSAQDLGELDPQAVERVRAEAWPDPRDADELHEALQWMGYLKDDEVGPWQPWLDELQSAGRVSHHDGCWQACDGLSDPLEVLSGRMQALGPILSDDPLLKELEARGQVLQVLFQGQTFWCERRLLNRIHRYTVEGLRKEIEAVSPADYWRFLCVWQHVAPGTQLEGPSGLLKVVQQLSAFDIPLKAWEKSILPQRIKNYRRDQLDQLMLSGQVAWGRLWSQGVAPLRNVPVSLFPMESRDEWLNLRAFELKAEHSSYAKIILELLQKRGAVFDQELRRSSGLLPEHCERGLSELLALGMISSDSFSALRQLMVPPSRRVQPMMGVGRWSLLEAWSDPGNALQQAELVTSQLLQRWGVLCRRVIDRERMPIPWRDCLKVLRQWELQGKVRGGRFVSLFSGEQFALPEAVRPLRRVRREQNMAAISVSAADPLNLKGIISPDGKVSPQHDEEIVIAS